MDRKQLAPLFDGWNVAKIGSYLHGYMGKGYADNANPPVSGQIVVGDFCFYAGIPDLNLVRNIPLNFRSKYILMVPRNDQWSAMIETCYGERAKKIKRYAVKKEPYVFDCAKLQQFTERLPEGYTLSMMDEALFRRTKQQDWSKDLTSQFPFYEQYRQYGIGTAVLYQNELVAGASSYTVYRGGIEIEIDTHESHRRRGLALACGAKLILSCLERGLYPSWDAHDMRSVALCEKLGYHFDKEYVAYCVEV